MDRVTICKEGFCLVLVIMLVCFPLLSIYPDGRITHTEETANQKDTRSTTWTPAEGWTEDSRLTNNVHGYNVSDLPAIASEGADVHLVFMNWQKDPSFEPYNRDLNIYYTRSVDGGRSWSAPNGSRFMQLNTPIEDRFFGFATLPAIAVSDSTVHVAWSHNSIGQVEKSRIRYRRSVDSGQTWLNETIMATNNDSWHANLLANGDSIHLFWQEYNSSLADWFRDRIFYSRSLDNGATWEPRRELARAEEISSPGCWIASAKDSNQRILLLYSCGDPRVTHFKRSMDNGATWEDGNGNENESTVLVRSTFDDYWTPYDIAVLQDSLTVVFRRRISTYSTVSDQLVVMSSNDLGGNWSTGKVIVDHTDAPSYPGCYDVPPNFDDCGIFIRYARMVSEGKRLYLLWTDSRVEGAYDLELFFMKSDDFGKTWSPQFRLTEAQEWVSWPDLHTSDGMIHVAWVDQRNDTADVCYKRFPDFGPLPSVETIGAFGVSGGEALLRGRLRSLENYTLASVFFEWRVEGEANWTRMETSELYDVGDYDFQISNLSSGTVYEFRAGARTESEVFGDILNFTAITLDPPADLRIDLEGLNHEDVLLSWNASQNDPSFVSSYSVFHSRVYDGNGSDYSILAEIPANGSSSYSYVHEGAGHGDNSSYFYFVQANATNHVPSRSATQVAKFSKFLSKGKHLISIPLVPSSKRIDDVLITVEFSRVWHYDSTTGWKSYSRFASYKADLLEIDRTMAIWIDVVLGGGLTVVGKVPNETTIQLRRGWNLVGFPSFDRSFTVQNLNEVIGAERVEGLDPLAPPYYLRQFIDTDMLRAGCGYWIKVGASVVWVVRN